MVDGKAVLISKLIRLLHLKNNDSAIIIIKMEKIKEIEIFTFFSKTGDAQKLSYNFPNDVEVNDWK